MKNLTFNTDAVRTAAVRTAELIADRAAAGHANSPGVKYFRANPVDVDRLDRAIRRAVGLALDNHTVSKSAVILGTVIVDDRSVSVTDVAHIGVFVLNAIGEVVPDFRTYNQARIDNGKYLNPLHLDIIDGNAIGELLEGEEEVTSDNGVSFIVNPQTKAGKLLTRPIGAKGVNVSAACDVVKDRAGKLDRRTVNKYADIGEDLDDPKNFAECIDLRTGQPDYVLIAAAVVFAKHRDVILRDFI